MPAAIQYVAGIEEDSDNLNLVGFFIPPKAIMLPNTVGYIANFGTPPPYLHKWETKGNVTPNGKTYRLTLYNLPTFYDLALKGELTVWKSLFSASVLYRTPHVVKGLEATKQVVVSREAIYTPELEIQRKRPVLAGYLRTLATLRAIVEGAEDFRVYHNNDVYFRVRSKAYTPSHVNSLVEEAQTALEDAIYANYIKEKSEETAVSTVMRQMMYTVYKSGIFGEYETLEGKALAYEEMRKYGKV